MQKTPVEDKVMQGVFIEHIKATQGMAFDEIKDYLYTKIECSFNNFMLNAYMSRGAVGVKTYLIYKTKTTEVAYFGKCGTAAGWNESTTVAYVSASLMDSRLM